MILLDRRGGSEGEKSIRENLLNPLLAAGLPAQITTLDSADVAFVGKGPKGAPVEIGIELKRLDGGSTDLTQSLRSGRLAGFQLPRMVGPDGAYDYAWLLVEGTWTHDDHGQVTVEQGRKRKLVPIRGQMTASTLEKQLLTLELCGGLHVRYCNSRRDTLRFIGALFRWWSDVSFDGHTSHLAVHTAPTLTPVSPFRTFVMRIPGVGHRLSAAVETHFKGSPRAAVCAGVAEWAAIVTATEKGQVRRIGTATATKIVKFLNGDK